MEKAVFSVQDNEEEQPQMRFYYPIDGETLWDIGKQFGISIDALKDTNDISVNTVPRVLFIPYNK